MEASELPRIAVRLIRDDRAPESLFALAAFHPPELAGVEEAFDRAWMELRGDCLDTAQATKRVAVELARLTLRGGMEPRRGLEVIVDLCSGLHEPWAHNLRSLQSWCEACAGGDERAVIQGLSELAGERAGPGAQPLR